MARRGASRSEAHKGGSAPGAHVRRSAREQPPWYARSLDFESLWREFPPPPDYVDRVHRLSRDALRDLQERRFLEQMQRAWKVPFYRRRWSAAGLEPGDIRGLEDLSRIPTYTVYDIRDSIARHPPWGDIMGVDFATDAPMPLIMQTSGGTTSLPRPMLYAPRDREVMNILMGRRLFMQGVRPFDLLQITMAIGLTNGGIAAREGAWKYSGAIPVMAGTGAHTPTRRQVEILKQWGAGFLMGFPAYLRHMGLVARDELGIDPSTLGVKGLLVHLGVDSRESLQELWGAPVYDCYGLHECGVVAADCRHRSGMHIFGDAFLVEIVDQDTGAPKRAGRRGSVVMTTLFRHLAPVIRYDTRDVSAFLPGTCACGGTHGRLERIFGRADQMVKLRGVNLFPEAVGEIVARDPRTNGEYVCVLETGGRGQDELRVLVEAAVEPAHWPGLVKALQVELKAGTGLRIVVDIVESGRLHALTGLTDAPKVRRLIDRRMSSAISAMNDAIGAISSAIGDIASDD